MPANCVKRIEIELSDWCLDKPSWIHSLDVDRGYSNRHRARRDRPRFQYNNHTQQGTDQQNVWTKRNRLHRKNQIEKLLLNLCRFVVHTDNELRVHPGLEVGKKKCRYGTLPAFPFHFTSFLPSPFLLLFLQGSPFQIQMWAAAAGLGGALPTNGFRFILRWKLRSLL